MSILAFDLDGTLITAGTRQCYLLRAVSRPFGIDIGVDDAWQRKRDGASNLQLLHEQGADAVTAARINSQWMLHVETPYWLSLDVPYADSLDVLAALTAQGHELVLITARGNAHFMRHQITRLGLMPCFAAVHCVSPRNAAQQKADILGRLGAAWFVGDTESDHAAACLSGTPFAAVGTGQRSPNYLIRSGVPAVHSSLSAAAENFLLHD